MRLCLAWPMANWKTNPYTAEQISTQNQCTTNAHRHLQEIVMYYTQEPSNSGLWASALPEDMHTLIPDNLNPTATILTQQELGSNTSGRSCKLALEIAQWSNIVKRLRFQHNMAPNTILIATMAMIHLSAWALRLLVGPTLKVLQ